MLRGQGHARSRVPWVVSADHFSRYNSNLLSILSLMVIVQSKNNARFGISAYESAINDPPCVEVIKGHMKSLTSDDLK